MMSFLGMGGCAAVLPQPSAPVVTTVWDGVFNDQQAQRGEESYTAHCRGCHGPEGSGGRATAITGDQFFARWGEDTLSGLFRSIAGTMPRNAPASLNQETYLDIVAYVLRINDYPVGAEELTAEAVGTILVTGRDGPGQVPNFQLVQVVGCLTKGSDGDWLVTNSSEPVRTRDPAPSRDLDRLEDTPLGSGVFSLMFLPSDPEEHRGRRVEVKGILIRADDLSSLNTMSLQPLMSACPP